MVNLKYVNGKRRVPNEINFRVLEPQFAIMCYQFMK